MGWKALLSGEQLWMPVTDLAHTLQEPEVAYGNLSPMVENWGALGFLTFPQSPAWPFSKFVIQAYDLNSLCLGFLS